MSAAATKLVVSAVALLCASLPAKRTNDTPFGPVAADGLAPSGGAGSGGTNVLPPLPPAPPGGGGAGGAAGSGIR